ncbi:hypothetical protein BLOT_009934, partial [Blomia tropicalis]
QLPNHENRRWPIHENKKKEKYKFLTNFGPNNQKKKRKKPSWAIDYDARHEARLGEASQVSIVPYSNVNVSRPKRIDIEMLSAPPHLINAHLMLAFKTASNIVLRQTPTTDLLIADSIFPDIFGPVVISWSNSDSTYESMFGTFNDVKTYVSKVSWET